MSRAFNEGTFSLFSLLQVKATSQIPIPNSFPFLAVFFFSPSFLLCKTTSPHPRIQNSKFKIQNLKVKHTLSLLFTMNI
ncbi:hypothetical protein HanRHA438_Chr10g0468921 [Helianthus annuus]|uniref:Uncharacterized protein n=1 Tax=Helianthus annuus TaxID=4232 RepID=A0A251TPD1_HELAN|nr:hypothetical protein HanXRQr2_Chr10g0455901 [Helianthus annuus]KAJ0523236.1 hypothetical protein HanIR_Chr10g0491541 [Helianthus annuus]KAJ0880950.1 hypothetical protein HanRHA438_Chr10g0468921 [Helianthus annuus]KAJ0885000.1 hypothetical protein HanPSC8_Chr10g0440331 [Helianthus annuus]